MKRIICIWILLLCMCSASAQSDIVFQHLNTANGLSYLGVNSLCTDVSGNLWLGTGNGLNKFNGKSVEKYFASEYPALQNSNIIHVTCDSANRIWVLTSGGHVTMLDEKRRFRRIGLFEQGQFVRTLWILNSGKNGIQLYTAKGNYTFRAETGWKAADSLSAKNFNFLPLKGYSELNMKGRNRVFAYDEEYYMLVYQEAFLKIKYSSNTVEGKYNFPELTPLIKWEDNSLLAYDRKTEEVKSINLNTREVTYPFNGLFDQYGRQIKVQFNYVIKIRDEKYVFTTHQDGVYIYDKIHHTISNYRHYYADPSSLGADNCTVLAAEPNGWVFISNLPDGISYFNPNDIISSKLLFTDNRGNGYDGFIAGIATMDNNTYYLGTSKDMIEWDKKNNRTRFIEFKKGNGESVIVKGEISSIAIDRTGKIWAGGPEDGVFVFDKSKKLLKHFTHDASSSKSLKISRVSRVSSGPDGYIWICGRNGVSRINPETLQIDNFENTPLAFFNSKSVVPVIFIDKDNMWLAASFDGLYHYNLATKKLTEIEAFRPFKKDGILDLKTDASGNIYIGNRAGLHIIFKDGRTKVYTQKEGLLIDRAEGIIRDRHNRIWIGNDIGLSCYNPADSGLKTFDVRYGLSIYGFRVGSYFQMPNGEFFFGTPHGIQYFHPDSLYHRKISLDLSVTKIETKEVVSTLTGSETIRLRATDNQITLHFGTVDYSPYLRTFYEYKLEELDKEWIKIADQNFVRYNSLPPGKYIFRVRASNDNMNWKESENEIKISIAVPFYATGWFRILTFLLASGLIWFVIRYYRRKQLKQKEELETESVINYFASQINRHKKTEDILWDLARNCISKLNFEDCVIYLLDEERNMLVQKAAWGPKMSRDFSIYQPIEIPVGKGIVGSVAEIGKPELITNTELDHRYIADDAKRSSELAVPLIIDNKVIGVIDSENSRKNFFTKRHLSILSTVAVLCATQIKRAKAEQEELEAQMVINYFASQIHSRFKTDELLNDVAKNLIGRMGFEECMIYLWNDDKTMLIQKAGYGAKGSMEAIINKEVYNIPKGKGIVSAAVESRQSLLVNDTSGDHRYFTADGKIMLSEFCVPLIHDEEVLGAINIEQHQKNFFTSKHQKVLSAIAVLCANQVQRIRAEEEKQQARIEALQNKQKAAETRLQSLRLQMNPHFLFNALNSIQQMILANEEMVATKYLSKFSKLLRTILVQSDKEFITLKEELDILRLYVELESIRFKSSFRYRIECDDEIDSEEIMVPTLLVQPFVENAIWHGLMHKEGDRLLQVKFFETGDVLHCIVEDNGVGREKSKEIKMTTAQGGKHTSKGIQVSLERLKAMGNGKNSGSLVIYDLNDENGHAAGTRVEIIFPTQNS